MIPSCSSPPLFLEPSTPLPQNEFTGNEDVAFQGFVMTGHPTGGFLTLTWKVLGRNKGVRFKLELDVKVYPLITPTDHPLITH